MSRSFANSNLVENRIQQLKESFNQVLNVDGPQKNIVVIRPQKRQELDVIVSRLFKNELSLDESAQQIKDLFKKLFVVPVQFQKNFNDLLTKEGSTQFCLEIICDSLLTKFQPPRDSLRSILMSSSSGKVSTDEQSIAEKLSGKDRFNTILYQKISQISQNHSLSSRKKSQAIEKFINIISNPKTSKPTIEKQLQGLLLNQEKTKLAGDIYLNNQIYQLEKIAITDKTLQSNVNAIIQVCANSKEKLNQLSEPSLKKHFQKMIKAVKARAIDRLKSAANNLFNEAHIILDTKEVKQTAKMAPPSKENFISHLATVMSTSKEEVIRVFGEVNLTALLKKPYAANFNNQTNVAQFVRACFDKQDLGKFTNFDKLLRDEINNSVSREDVSKSADYLASAKRFLTTTSGNTKYIVKELDAKMKNSNLLTSTKELPPVTMHKEKPPAKRPADRSLEVKSPVEQIKSFFKLKR